MKIIITNLQKQILQESTDFNIICILQYSLDENTLTLSETHTEMLYDFCCESTDINLFNLATLILKNDKNTIKPFVLN